METWQLCPKCKGGGEQNVLTWPNNHICDLCNGHRVISIFTGKPPLITTSTNTTVTTNIINSK